MNATIIAREDLSASDADLDIIYYELNSTVQVSIFLWGEKKKKKAREKSLCLIQMSPSFEAKGSLYCIWLLNTFWKRCFLSKSFLLSKLFVKHKHCFG